MVLLLPELLLWCSCLLPRLLLQGSLLPCIASAAAVGAKLGERERCCAAAAKARLNPPRPAAKASRLPRLLLPRPPGCRGCCCQGCRLCCYCCCCCGARGPWQHQRRRQACASPVSPSATAARRAVARVNQPAAGLYRRIHRLVHPREHAAEQLVRLDRRVESSFQGGLPAFQR